MMKRIRAWLPLVFGGAVLLAGSAGSCVANTLRDAADRLDGTPQNLEEVEDLDDFAKWFDSQFGGD